MSEIRFGDSGGSDKSGGGMDVDEMLDNLTKVMDRIQDDPRLRAMFQNATGAGPANPPNSHTGQIEGEEAMKGDMSTDEILDIIENVEAYLGSDATIGQVKSMVQQNPEQVETLLGNR